MAFRPAYRVGWSSPESQFPICTSTLLVRSRIRSGITAVEPFLQCSLCASHTSSEEVYRWTLLESDRQKPVRSAAGWDFLIKAAPVSNQLLQRQASTSLSSLINAAMAVKNRDAFEFFSGLSPMRLACRVVTPPQLACMQRIALGFATNSKQVERPYQYVVAY